MVTSKPKRISEYSGLVHMIHFSKFISYLLLKYRATVLMLRHEFGKPISLNLDQTQDFTDSPTLFTTAFIAIVNWLSCSVEMM